MGFGAWAHGVVWGPWKWLRPVTPKAALDMCYSEPERPDQGSTEGSSNTAGIPPQPHAGVNKCVSQSGNTEGSRKAAGIPHDDPTDTCEGLSGSTWIRPGFGVSVSSGHAGPSLGASRRAGCSKSPACYRREANAESGSLLPVRGKRECELVFESVRSCLYEP